MSAGRVGEGSRGGRSLRRGRRRRGAATAEGIERKLGAQLVLLMRLPPAIFVGVLGIPLGFENSVWF